MIVNAEPEVLNSIPILNNHMMSSIIYLVGAVVAIATLRVVGPNTLLQYL